MRRSLVNLMLSGWAVLGLVGISATTAGEPLRVTPAVQTVTAGQATSNVELTGWRHGWGGRGYYGGAFYGGGWGHRHFGGWGPRFYGYSGYRPYSYAAYGYAPYGYGAYHSSFYRPYGAFYRPYPVAAYSAPVYSAPVYSGAYYGGPYSGGYAAPVYYGGYGYPAYGWAPAYTVTYRPYWGGGYYGYVGGYYW